MNTNHIPHNFVILSEFIPSIKLQLAYACDDNFTGSIVPGYKNKKAYLTIEAATQLKKVQEYFLKQNLSLIIFDAYRPKRAVEYFINDWKNQPENQVLKMRFYPHKSKIQLFEEGFLATRSSHSKGSTVDLSLVNIKNNQHLNMGSEFDYFDELSFTLSQDISEDIQQNRNLLCEVMNKFGFINYSKEWWHFRLNNEPYPETFFDFET